MRRLILIPLIHDEADMGAVGETLARGMAMLSGPDRWERHRETMASFWRQVAAHLRGLEPSKLKLYQDGLPVSGDTARRIVHQAAERGSRNYQLILELVAAGAELRATEDSALLLREYHYVTDPPANSGSLDTSKVEQDRAQLKRERDEFIAQTIDATLKEHELGVLFLGAEHQVCPLLARDIAVEAFKDPERMIAYFRALVSRDGASEQARLAAYLTASLAVR